MLIAAAIAVPATAAPLSFGQVFSSAGEPASLHFEVAFLGPDGIHHMAVWRDHDRRVKRVTDGAIVSIATHRPGDPGYRLTVLDLKRRMSTRIDRTNLYRVGNFTDWFDLTHGLRFPKGTYALTRGAVPAAAPSLLAGCRWYDLSQDGRVSHICWDGHARLPLVIVAMDGRTVWRVTTLDTRPAPASTFAVNDEGYIKNDADRDIERD